MFKIDISLILGSRIQFQRDNWLCNVSIQGIKPKESARYNLSAVLRYTDMICYVTCRLSTFLPLLSNEASVVYYAISHVNGIM